MFYSYVFINVYILLLRIVEFSGSSTELVMLHYSSPEQTLLGEQFVISATRGLSIKEGSLAFKWFVQGLFAELVTEEEFS